MYVDNIGIINAKGRFKEQNEDYHLVVKNTLNNDKTSYFACIADGMGGYDNANVASHFVIDSLENWWKNYLSNHTNVDHLINELDSELSKEISKLNHELIEKGKLEELKYGTTLSILIIIENVYFVYHVGDGRVYRYDSNLKFEKGTIPLDEKNGLTQLTLDHTISNLSQYPNANTGTLTQCIGVKGEVDVFQTFGTFNKNTFFILCTDGVYKSFEKSEFEQFFSSEKTAQEIVDNVYNEIKDREFTDDICLIIINDLID
ncbi:serine/threonine protein phosphatase [Phocicoccus schoeneichii]|uniref:PPM-type phosphatase domain-containing protein n=1 Tax=Phocicoccus schoeneichii TaxID=1812261 RepID=A0A6V7R9I0_9BACL|nr:PP2C family serine/threonine-protein phosphatase [Jeotgalicoccus schoeneichii]GGH53213.1 serine/threonine protein phosphatase [Jeotgalicoccus schoeneichii]CAD2073926.1 Putative protein phosphatase 2C-type [Jeotgalicoccus schoeneichii]